MKHDEKTQIELEAAVFRRLLQHLRKRSDVQNIDMMNLAGFCRNCLSNWFEDAARERGLEVARDEARTMVYGMPQEEWKARFQKAANDVQNIDMMNLAGFCRNCLSNWFEDAAKERGLDVARDEARTMVYGMPQEERKAHFQKAADDMQKAAFDKIEKH